MPSWSFRPTPVFKLVGHLRPCLSGASFPKYSGQRRVARVCACSTVSSTSGGTSKEGTTTQGQPSPPKKLGFGFSAGGLVFPYLVGTVEGLQTAGLLTSESPCAGASAGSLTACLFLSGLSSREMMEGAIKLSIDCRSGGTRGRLKHVLENVLRDVLPADAHIKCSGKAHVAITQVYPVNGIGGKLISEFGSREDLIQTMLTSCHIPVWFNNSLFRGYRSVTAFDGGVTNFIPGPPSCDRVVRITCFPLEGWGENFGVDIAPDIFGECKYSVGQMISWAFNPAEPDKLWEFYRMGKADALAFASSSRVETPQTVQIGSTSSAMWRRLRSMLIK